MTLADHAEAWAREQGKPVPPRDTPEWHAMYEAWHADAFRGFRTKPRYDVCNRCGADPANPVRATMYVQTIPLPVNTLKWESVCKGWADALIRDGQAHHVTAFIGTAWTIQAEWVGNEVEGWATEATSATTHESKSEFVPSYVGRRLYALIRAIAAVPLRKAVR